MIDSFEKERFMHEPIEVTIERDYFEACAYGNNKVAEFVNDQTIILNIGGNNYDVRDLIWRLFESERMVNDLNTRLFNLENDTRVLNLENDYEELKGRVVGNECLQNDIMTQTDLMWKKLQF